MFAILDLAAGVEHPDLSLGFREGIGMARERFTRDFADPDAADTGGRSRKEVLHERCFESHRFEDLRAAVGADGGDPHLRHDLEQAFLDRRDIVLDGGFKPHRRRQPPALFQVSNSFEGEVGVHRACAITEEHGKVHDIARLGGFDDQSGELALLGLDQVAVDGGDREERRDRRFRFRCLPVRQNEKGIALVDLPFRSQAELPQ